MTLCSCLFSSVISYFFSILNKAFETDTMRMNAMCSSSILGDRPVSGIIKEQSWTKAPRESALNSILKHQGAVGARNSTKLSHQLHLEPTHDRHQKAL